MLFPIYDFSTIENNDNEQRQLQHQQPPPPSPPQPSPQQQTSQMQEQQLHQEQPYDAEALVGRILDDASTLALFLTQDKQPKSVVPTAAVDAASSATGTLETVSMPGSPDGAGALNIADDVAGEEEVEQVVLVDSDANNVTADAAAETMDTEAAAAGEKQAAEAEPIYMPLLDYLCAYQQCTLKELQVLFNCLTARKRMLTHIRTVCRLRTSHLQPAERNIPLHAHDLSAQNANLAHACNGYLDITVRQYFYIKHGRKLKHPYLPCLIEFGGGAHASYYPLEVVSVQILPPPPPSQHCAKSPQTSRSNSTTTTPTYTILKKM